MQQSTCIASLFTVVKDIEMKFVKSLVAVAISASCACAFAPFNHSSQRQVSPYIPTTTATITPPHSTTSSLRAAVPDLDVVGLVAGQENYGLAVVCMGEALWSFFQAPSFDHAKVLVPATIAALVLGLVSGPMITSGDASQVSLGLFIATGVSLALGASYVARLVAAYSPSPKEIAALGLLVAVAGFFSFSQNLIVDGFVTLPSIPMPTLPSIELPDISFGE